MSWHLIQAIIAEHFSSVGPLIIVFDLGAKTACIINVNNISVNGMPNLLIWRANGSPIVRDSILIQWITSKLRRNDIIDQYAAAHTNMSFTQTANVIWCKDHIWNKFDVKSQPSCWKVIIQFPRLAFRTELWQAFASYQAKFFSHQWHLFLVQKSSIRRIQRCIKIEVDFSTYPPIRNLIWM